MDYEAADSYRRGLVLFISRRPCFSGFLVLLVLTPILFIIKTHLHSADSSDVFQDAPLLSESAATKPGRIFCWIMTSPASLKRAHAVRDTWVKRCDGYVFVSSVNDSTLPSVAAGVAEGREHLWGKTQFGFRYSYANVLTQYDWFMKADDDTFVIVRNLRRLLAGYSSASPVFFGQHFLLPGTKLDYMSGGAGYVLSREAVKRLVKIGLVEKTNGTCRLEDGGAEDVNLGECMQKVGVKAVDTRDEHGRGRFFAMAPDFHTLPEKTKESTDWYRKYLVNPEKGGLACCSDTAISFHYVQANQMYAMELLTNQMR